VSARRWCREKLRSGAHLALCGFRQGQCRSDAKAQRAKSHRLPVIELLPYVCQSVTVLRANQAGLFCLPIRISPETIIFVNLRKEHSRCLNRQQAMDSLTSSRFATFDWQTASPSPLCANTPAKTDS